MHKVSYCNKLHTKYFTVMNRVTDISLSVCPLSVSARFPFLSLGLFFLSFCLFISYFVSLCILLSLFLTRFSSHFLSLSCSFSVLFFLFLFIFLLTRFSVSLLVFVVSLSLSDLPIAALSSFAVGLLPDTEGEAKKLSQSSDDAHEAAVVVDEVSTRQRERKRTKRENREKTEREKRNESETKRDYERQRKGQKDKE